MKKYLVRIGDPFLIPWDASRAKEMYFANHPNFDEFERGVWTGTMEEASGLVRMLRDRAARTLVMNIGFDIVSKPSSWEIANQALTDINSLAAGINFHELSSAPVPDDALQEGDNDIDVPTGRDAISLAESGVCGLRLIKDGTAIPITIEQAKKIVETDPNAIIISFDPDTFFL